jgi:hypothetical protein
MTQMRSDERAINFLALMSFSLFQDRWRLCNLVSIAVPPVASTTHAFRESRRRIERMSSRFIYQPPSRVLRTRVAGCASDYMSFSSITNSFSGRYPAFSMSSSHVAGSFTSFTDLPVPPARTCALFLLGSPQTRMRIP